MKPKWMLALTMVSALIAMISMTIAAVALAAPDTLQPAGKMRVAMQSGSNAVNMTSTSYQNIPNLATNVTVPGGKVADLVIQFCGVMNSPDALYVRAQFDASNVSPSGDVQAFYDTSGGATSQCFTWYKLGVGSGLHVVEMQWKGLGGQQFMSQRSLVVWANIRNP